MNFPSKSKTVTLNHFLMPVIRYRFREISCADLEKKFKGVDFRHKNDPFPPFWAYEFFFKIQNILIKPLFNACYQIQFQKNLTNRFCLNVDFGPKKTPFNPFWA